MSERDDEWSWLIFLLNKNSWMWVIVAHFVWEVIVSDLAHEKSELVHLWLWLGMYRCIKSSPSILLVGLKIVFELKCYAFCITYCPPRNFNFFQYIVRGNIPADCWSILHHHILFFLLYFKIKAFGKLVGTCCNRLNNI